MLRQHLARILAVEGSIVKQKEVITTLAVIGVGVGLLWLIGKKNKSAGNGVDAGVNQPANNLFAPTIQPIIQQPAGQSEQESAGQVAPESSVIEPGPGNVFTN